MAKIAKFEKWSEVLKKNICGDVYYHLNQNRNHGDDGFFFVPIPEDMKDLHEQFEHAEHFYNRGAGKYIIKGASAEEAKKNFVAYHEMYKQAKAVVEKVIVYRFKFSSKNKSSDPVKKSGGYMSSMDGVSSTLKARIEFDFCVCEKTKFGGKVTYKALDEGDKHKHHWREGRDAINEIVKKTGKSYGGWVELEYSVETEAFFAQVYAGMEGVMDKLMKYIGTEDLALDAIANHQKLLA